MHIKISGPESPLLHYDVMFLFASFFYRLVACRLFAPGFEGAVAYGAVAGILAFQILTPGDIGIVYFLRSLH